MAVQPAELIKSDQDHLIHPLHHPSDHLEPMVYVKGRGATITDIQGREYIDGLAGLWNTNVGHGREELAKAAATQMGELAYFSAYAGSSNFPPAIRTGRRGPSRARRRARLRHGCSRRRLSARGPTRWPPSSPSPFTAGAACSIPPTTTFPSCARSATSTRCCSSRTR